jgi:hypothetical protein
MRKKKSSPHGLKMAGNLWLSAEVKTPCDIKVKLNRNGRWWMIAVVANRKKLERFGWPCNFVDLEIDGLNFRVPLFNLPRTTGNILVTTGDFLMAWSKAWWARWTRDHTGLLRDFGKPGAPTRKGYMTRAASR